jgi:nitrite transporter NirC
MYADSVQTVSDQAISKIREQHRSLVGHLVRSVLAGMYVAAAIVLIFSIGGSLSEVARPAVPMIMGICFGGALTIVIFAGSELFTGSNLVMTLGVLTRKTKIADLLTNWGWTWIGNLAGSVLIAVLVIRSGVFDAEPIKTFVLKLVEKKMNYGPEALLYRSILANWLVCLGVWMSARIKNEAARVLMIWWCMFTFITCGYEHSIANMCGLMLGLLLPHEGFNITWAGYAYNLGLSTLGNIIGGAVFVGMAYWIGSAKLWKREPAPTEAEVASVNNGLSPAPTPTPALAETE